jgi:hypothetical protein
MLPGTLLTSNTFVLTRFNLVSSTTILSSFDFMLSLNDPGLLIPLFSACLTTFLLIF